MDLRELKKRCKKAVEILVRDHGYQRDQFTTADGSETFYAPSNLDEKHVRNGFIDPGVHKGTLVHWYRCSYEYDEWNCELPSEILSEIEFWAKLTPAELAEMAKEKPAASPLDRTRREG